MIVKICGITNLRDTDVAIDAGASAVGFNFYPASPRFIAREAAKVLIAAVPAKVLKVGIFVNESPAVVADIMMETGLDIAQVIGTAPSGVRYWRVHRVSTTVSEADLNDDGADAFLLDTPSDSLHGGTGRTFDWALARIAARRIIIAGGLGPDNVIEAIRACRPWGVDACSQLESSPGRKDPQKVRAFVAAALSV